MSAANVGYMYHQNRLRGQDYSASPAENDMRLLPDGALPVGDWYANLVMRGLAWHVSIGAFSTPIAGGGAAAIIDLDQPRGLISVPRGTCLVPLRVHVQCQVPLLATDSDESEIVIAVDRANAWARDGTRTDEDAFNMRTDIVGGCPCLAASAFSADTTDPVLDVELAHAVIIGDVQGVAATAFWNPLELLYEPRRPPFIVGPAMLLLYWGGTVATTGFAQVQFAAIPSSKVTGLA